MTINASFVIFCVFLGIHSVSCAGIDEPCGGTTSICVSPLKCIDSTCQCSGGFYFSATSNLCLQNCTSGTTCQCPSDAYQLDNTTCAESR
ncbi:hypothetical protein ElyMa_000161000 [Elysia marginata]|uniref:TIL domain-containing protein n=1 Tax=Elysia marginata TaxID=1093978 RepID=A0AAV4ESY9_9GAST|nr:hypothetical protein ElyMa_000161000 [Elysia marginata]